MGLDAYVACDCYELGRMRPSPPVPAIVAAHGFLHPASNVDLKTSVEFDSWRRWACEHEDQTLAHRRIGNVSAVAGLRLIIERLNCPVPIISEKVIYSGSHSGDYLALEDVESLGAELDRLEKQAATTDLGDDRWLIDQFLDDMRALREAAMSVRKPIAFI